jgi:hypothetical protein
LEGRIKYQEVRRPSQGGVRGLGEPVGTVLACERVLRRFKKSVIAKFEKLKVRQNDLS